MLSARRLGLLALSSGLITVAKCKASSPKPSDTTTKQDRILGPRIAVIGSGIGGSSCAYYLHQYFGPEVCIDLYEKYQIGGRAAVASVSGEKVEAGASIIHKKNHYMTQFVKTFNLEKKPCPSAALGLCNGKDIYFEGYKDSFLLALQLLWRYGVDMLRIQFLVVNLLQRFETIYGNQDRGEAFSNVEDLLYSMSVDFVTMTRRSFRSVLAELDFKEPFITEIATAAGHNNYGQDVHEMHGFVGVVSLCGVQPGLWAVKGGNFQVAEGFVKISKANLVKSLVKEVKLLKDGRYELLTDGQETTEYDIVVLAAPQHERSSITLTGLPGHSKDLKSPYQRIFTNIIHGSVNPGFFTKMGKEAIEIPCENSETNTSNPFNTFAANTAVDDMTTTEIFDCNSWKIWKLFSKRPLTEEELKSMFKDIKDMKVIDWLAYPHYTFPEKLSSFIVHDNFYYVNAIERAASAMEMSIIGGRNVALLAHNHWFGLMNKIDNDVVLNKGKKNKGNFLK